MDSITTKEHFYHVGGKESNRNAVYEALLSSIELESSISNAEMKSRIELNESPLTGKEKEYEIPVQLTMALEEQKRLTLYKNNSGFVPNSEAGASPKVNI